MLSRFHLIPERHGRTDRQTGRRTDRFAISISRVGMLTRDKNVRIWIRIVRCGYGSDTDSKKLISAQLVGDSDSCQIVVPQYTLCYTVVVPRNWLYTVRATQALKQTRVQSSINQSIVDGISIAPPTKHGRPRLAM